MIDKALNFLAYFSHPDLSFGGEYASRNTKYIIPSGIEYSARWNDSARRILFSLRRALSSEKSIGPFNLDDRYLAYIGYTYIQAHENFYGEELKNPFYEEKFSKFFPESGIFIESNKNFYVIGNLRKQGVLRIDFKNSNCSLKDSGPVVYVKERIYSPFLSPQCKISSTNGYIVEGSLLKIPLNIMTPFKNLLLRIFQMTFGRNKRVSFLVENILRGRLIAYKKNRR
ncbi:MAG: hypothetical protein ACPLVD_09115 [Dictyoglomus turgidum]|uniref:hypothetical protein n=1 Tax=Dictyoglomus turgidum TaxID=513050 RepID=UPI003C71CFFA